MRNQLLILEGSDCSGKTTLANKIIDFYGKDNCNYIHSSFHKKMDVLKDHTQTLDEAIGNLKNYTITILDRHWISECIYGKVYRQGCSYGNEAINFHNRIMQYNGQYILCLPNKTIVKDNHKRLSQERSEMFTDISGVINMYWDLWYGSHKEEATDDIGKHNYIEYLIHSGGVHTDMFWHMWDYEKHDDHFGEFITDVVSNIGDIDE